MECRRKDQVIKKTIEHGFKYSADTDARSKYYLGFSGSRYAIHHKDIAGIGNSDTRNYRPISVVNPIF